MATCLNRKTMTVKTWASVLTKDKYVYVYIYIYRWKELLFIDYFKDIVPNTAVIW
jgi:hypothetical protein